MPPGRNYTLNKLSIIFLRFLIRLSRVYLGNPVRHQHSKNNRRSERVQKRVSRTTRNASKRSKLGAYQCGSLKSTHTAITAGQVCPSSLCRTRAFENPARLTCTFAPAILPPFVISYPVLVPSCDDASTLSLSSLRLLSLQCAPTPSVQQTANRPCTASSSTMQWTRERWTEVF